MFPLFGPVQTVTAFGALAWLPLLPLLGAIINLMAGRRLQDRVGARAVHAIAVVAMLATTTVALASVVRLLSLPPDARFLLDRRWVMLAVGDLHVDVAFALDPLAAVLLVVITVVGTLIHVYAMRYMHGDPGQWRFFAYLNLFVAAMLVLVLGDSLWLAFVGWEGVGLCSYLLIGFWYAELPNAVAARKAFVTNRIGDAGFVLGSVALFWGLGGFASSIAYSNGGATERASAMVWQQARPGESVETRVRAPLGPTLSFRELKDQLGFRAPGHKAPVAIEYLRDRTLLGIPALTLAALLLFIGACGKSAQLPLQVWLPDAMAGPTPVSALIHAATMVTAGVYLMARTSFLFSATPQVGGVIAVVGVVTALVGALAATVQYDVKRVLAYSTISQLGFMFLAVGTGAYAAAVFHLVTHACFKACLFLAAGSLIHGMHHLRHEASERGAGFDARLAPHRHDSQDLRNMGGLAGLMPRTHLAYLVGCISIAGLPVAAGFYSKDEIIAKAFATRGMWVSGPWLAGAALLAAALTAYYMFRSYYLAFHARAADARACKHVTESPPSMTIVLLVLAVLAIVSGPLLGWPAAWGGQPWLERFVEPALVLPAGRFIDEPHRVHLMVQAASVLAAVAGWAAAHRLYRRSGSSALLRERLALRASGLHAFLYAGLGFDAFFRAAVLGPVRTASDLAGWLDRHVVDGVVHLGAEIGRILAAVGGWLDRRLVDGLVNGLADLSFTAGRRLMSAQSGRIGHYVFGFAAGVVALTAVAIAWYFT